MVLSSFNVKQMCRNYEKLMSYGCYVDLSGCFDVNRFLFLSQIHQTVVQARNQRESHHFLVTRIPSASDLEVYTSLNLP